MGKNCGEFDLNGLWIRTGVKSGRPRYTLAGNRNAIMEWSESRMAWRLYVDETWLGHGRPTLLIAASESRTFPTSGWQAVDGIGPVPQVETFRQSAPSTFLQSGGLEGSLWLKGADYGTHEATCSADEEDVEKAGHWCLSRCPPGY